MTDCKAKWGGTGGSEKFKESGPVCVEKWESMVELRLK